MKNTLTFNAKSLSLIVATVVLMVFSGVNASAQNLVPVEDPKTEERYVAPSEMVDFILNETGLASNQLIEVYAVEQDPKIVMISASVDVPIVTEDAIQYLLIRDSVSNQWIRHAIEESDWDSVVRPYFDDAGLPVASQPSGTYDSLTPAQEAQQLSLSLSHTGTEIRNVIVNGPVSTPADIKVGHLAGEFAVGQTGEANYQIPIPSPRGVAGMAPNLALIYNSRAGQGQFGKGWSMSGLSAVSRCGKTLATDGMVRPVQFDDTDAYCLDGQRLIKTSAAGASIEEYRTEIESFQRIRAYRTASTTGITYWQVTDKSGQKRFYGLDTNGRALLGSTTIVSNWLINKQQDLFQNSIKYVYQNDTGANKIGGYAVYRIYWENKLGQKMGMVEVKNDLSRPDKRAGFSANGNKVTSRYRANAIEILSRPHTASTSLESLQTSAVIKLSYDDYTGKPDNGSYLKAAQQCAANGVKCLASTDFDYDYGQQWFGANYAANLGHSDRQVFADVTGDGRPDFVYVDGGYIKVKISGTTGVVNTGAYVHGYQTESRFMRVLDVNGDGLQDLLLATNNGGSRIFKVFKAYKKSNGDPGFTSSGGTANLGSTAPSNFFEHHHFVYDIDHDGLPEVFAKRGGKLWYFKNNNGTLDTWPSGTNLTVTDEQVFTPLEYDGDGLPELLVNRDGCSSSGGGGGPGGPGGTIQYREDGSISIGDLQIQNQGSSNTLGTTTCGATAGIWKWNFDTQELDPVVMGGDAISTSGIGGQDNYNQLLDFNGDGLTDMAVAPKANSGPLNKWRFFVNKGSAWHLAGELAVGSDGRDKIAQFDYNGDGIQEMMLGKNSKWYRFNVGITRTASTDSYSFALVNTLKNYDGDSGYFMDWNGDGLQDYVSIHGGNYHIKTHKGSKHGLLMHIQNGLGDDTNISYVALSMGSESVVYNGPTGTPVFPVRHFQAPYYLVQSFAADTGRHMPDGADIKMVTNYTYGGAKFHQQGRGFLGFDHIEAHNVNSQIVTHNYHMQEFPYTGMVKRSEQWTPDLQNFEDVDWDDIFDEFEPCDGSSGEPCVQPRSADNGKGKPDEMLLQRNQTTAGTKLMETVNVFDNIQLGSTSNNTDRYFPFIDVSTEKRYNFGTTVDTVIKRTVTDTNYSTWGNATSILVTVDDGNNGDVHSVSTTNTYSNFTTSWCLGRLSTSSVTHTRAVDDAANNVPLTESRSSSFGYNSSNCTLTSEVTQPNDTNWSLTKVYGYDGFGNRKSEQVSGPGITTRTTTTQFDTYGHFPLTATNDLGHTVSTQWNSVFGVKTSVTDANGVSTTYQHDDFGRVTRVQSPYTAMYTTTNYAWCNSGNCVNPESMYRVSETSSAITHSDKTTKIIEFDALGREIHTRARSFDGTFVHKQAVFDMAGRALATSNPYFATDPSICWNVNVHDALGRVKQEIKPVDETQCNPVATSYVPRTANLSPITNNYTGVTTFDFDGLVTTVIDPQGRQITRTVNVMDRLRLISELDDDGGTINTEYGYDALGNTTWVKDDAGNVSKMTYNVRGFKMTMDDPDMGYWTYNYNTLGELIRQEDAKGQVTTMTYDTLGRLVTRVEPEGSSTRYYDEAGTSWDPDYYGKSVGKVTSILNHGDSHYDWERFLYRGLAGEMDLKFERTNSKTYATYIYFDSYGRHYRSLLPTSETTSNDYWASANRLDYRYSFNSFGFSYKTTDYSQAHGGSASEQYWQGLSQDAFGNFTSFTLDNQTLPVTRVYDRATGAMSSTTGGVNGSKMSQHYEWDAVGNLTERRDLIQSWKETFDYDGLYRLDKVNFHPTLNGAAQVRGRYKYDSIGNILCKDSTSVSSSNCTGGYRNYLYGSGNNSSAGTAGPHAVTRVTTSLGNRNYSYDNNGNLTTVSGGGATRNLTWTSFNKVKTISVTADSTTELFYRPDRSRYKQIVIKDGVTTTTNYVGDYEKRNVDGVIKHIYYIRGGGEVVAQVTRNEGNATANIGSENIRYFLRDHQSSIVSTLSSTGISQENLSYDAFGKRRSPAAMDFTSPLQYLTSATTTRGYTGHEHMDHVGFINMNGRIYDAEIGRFLSADPFVQYPESTQGFNRYTYVQNNPLSYSDPSGFFLKKLMKAVSFAMNFIPGLQFGNVFLQGFVTGFLGSGGDLKAGLIGGLSAGIFKSIGDHFGNPAAFSAKHLKKTLAHGLAGGAMSKAGGGRFGDGFLGSASAQLSAGTIERHLGQAGSGGSMGKLKRTIAASVIGGTSSAIGGGKFGQGATSAAFSRMFNDENEDHAAESDEPLLDEDDAGKLEKFRRRIGRFFDQKSGAPKATGTVVDAGIQALDPDVWEGIGKLTVRSNLDLCIAISTCGDADRVAIGEALSQTPIDYAGVSSVFRAQQWEYQNPAKLLYLKMVHSERIHKSEPKDE